MRPTLKTLCLAALGLILFSQCKARKNFANLSSDDERAYNASLSTNVVQELFKGMKFPGNVHLALSPDGSTLATVGSVLSESSPSANDITGEEFTFNYETNQQGQGGLTAIYLWDARTLQPTSKTIKKIDGYEMKGIRSIAFTTDGKGIAVCGDSGVAFWPDTQNVDNSKIWRSNELAGNCLSISFGRLRDVGPYGNDLLTADVLAIGTSTGVIRYMHTKEKPAPEIICTFGKPVSALSFVGEVKTDQGYSVPDANQLLVTVGSSAERSGFQLLENRTRTTTGNFGILPFVTMPAIGKLNLPGLNLGNVSRDNRSSRSTTVSCNEALNGRLDKEFTNPSAVTVHSSEIMLSSTDNRYVQLFNQSGQTLQVKAGSRKMFVASTEKIGGIPAIAMGGPYGVFNSRYYFTGGADRTARIWQYNIDGTQKLDVLSQINMGMNNSVTSAVFLKDRPVVIFGDKGGVFVWNFAKALQPTLLKLPARPSRYSAIAMNDSTGQVYLGTETGDLTVDSYESGANIQNFSKLFQGPVQGIEVAHDLSTFIAYSGGSAKIFEATSTPDRPVDLDMWEGQAGTSIVGFRYGTDNVSVFSANQNGMVRVKNSSTGDTMEFAAKLNDTEKVIDFSAYPMDIKYRKIVEFNKESNQDLRELEIHPLIVPVISPKGRGQGFSYIQDPFQIFGENQRRKLDQITGQAAGTTPQPSSENPELTSGSKQNVNQSNDQKSADQAACQNGLCETNKTMEQALAEAQRMANAIELRDTNVDVKHLKVALLLSSGRIIMADLAGKTQWNLEYRTSPILSFSGFFQHIYRDVKASGDTGAYNLNGDTSYLARSIKFDDDGACLMILIRSGDHLRCLPVLPSSGKNAPSITELSSKPAKPFLDPWVVYNVFDRKISDFQLAQYYTMAVAADSKGGITSFELNHFRMPPYSKRMYRTNYSAASTKGAVVKKLATTSTSQYAIAIHADNTVRLHWIDRAFELPLLDISNEDLDALRNFAQ